MWKRREKILPTDSHVIHTLDEKDHQQAKSGREDADEILMKFTGLP